MNLPLSLDKPAVIFKLNDVRDILLHPTSPAIVMSDDNAFRNYLAAHPKMTGVLFTILLLLSQAGTVAAGNSTIAGP